MRELLWRAEEGIKAGGPDRLEQEKHLIGIKCPDRVRGQLNYVKCADFPLCNSEREKGGEKHI